jgi:hypothetical protein
VRVVAAVAFLAGLILAVRVMLFGVQRRIDDEHLAHRAWPLALAAFLIAGGVTLYAATARDRSVTVGWAAAVVLVGVAAGAGARWLVKRSAARPSSDPEDDPRYRFQGHVARVIEPIEAHSGGGTGGRIAFDFDGKRYELRACWSPETETELQLSGHTDSEVVIERVEGDLAYVEPWTVVEGRL